MIEFLLIALVILFLLCLVSAALDLVRDVVCGVCGILGGCRLQMARAIGPNSRWLLVDGLEDRA